MDEEDEGNTGNESDDESDADDCADESLNIVDIVWSNHGRVWYPAVVATLEDIPENIRQYLRRSLVGKRIVRWWSEKNVSALAEKNMESLARNQLDEFWANRSKLISKLYNQAVSENIVED